MQSFELFWNVYFNYFPSFIDNIIFNTYSAFPFFYQRHLLLLRSSSNCGNGDWSNLDLIPFIWISNALFTLAKIVDIATKPSKTYGTHRLHLTIRNFDARQVFFSRINKTLWMSLVLLLQDSPFRADFEKQKLFKRREALDIYLMCICFALFFISRSHWHMLSFIFI